MNILSTLRELFPFILAIYILDCLLYVRKRHLLLVSHLRHFRLKRNGIRAGSFFPSGQTVGSHQTMLLFSRTGIHYIPEDTPENLFYAFQHFEFLEYSVVSDLKLEGNKLFRNHRAVLVFPSSATARIWKLRMEEIARTAEKERSAAIRKMWNESYDLETLTQKRSMVQRALKPVYWLTFILFSLLFVLVPVLLYFELAQLFLEIVMGVMGILYLMNVWQIYVFHKKIGTPRKELRNSVLILTFSPLSCIRAAQHLTLNLFASYHYLTLSSVLDQESFMSLARKELLFCSDAPAGADDSFRTAVKDYESALLKMLSNSGFEAKSLLKPPAKEDSLAERYCPNCSVEYRKGIEECVDCGLNLRFF